MKGVIERLDFNLSSPKDLARAILEKIVSIYVAMRNRLSRFGDKIIPQEAMKIPIPEEKRQALKMKYKVTYNLDAISKSEEAFLKAIRRDHQRCTLPYFFGILKNIQDEMDAARYEDYCHERYYYQRMLDREREEQEKAKETTTVENLVAMLRNAILSRHRFIKDTCVRQAKRMAADLKKQYHYAGALKKKILDELGNLKELRIEQRKEVVKIMELVLS